MRIGTVARLFRYPVKSMRGEEVGGITVGLQGLPGDRRYAFVQAEKRSGFPWLTAREVAEMLRYRPQYEGEYLGPGREPPLQVEAPDGRRFAVDAPELRAELEHKLDRPVFLMRDHRGNYDVAPVSIFSLATVGEVGARAGRELDPRRFRANFYVQPDVDAPPEAEWVGKVLAVGPELRLAVTEPDERCVIINLDPDQATDDPAVLKTVATEFGNRAGVYAVVLHPGAVRVGDAVEILGAV